MILSTVVFSLPDQPSVPLLLALVANPQYDYVLENWLCEVQFLHSIKKQEMKTVYIS